MWVYQLDPETKQQLSGCFRMTPLQSNLKAKGAWGEGKCLLPLLPNVALEDSRTVLSDLCVAPTLAHGV